ncbi:hypothetical protein [uncultured Aquimarina sp.]|uniref:DUF6924 domain-containing protein n=1 Tax=uncultured Aquimarina sp. TaxID=575652 RepID=UPI00260B0400|nr:hypothetical protein [uncultured Aquimarina sp.]
MNKDSRNYIEKKEISKTKDVIVLRTNFNDDILWEKLCELISEPNKEYGYKAYVEFVNNIGHNDIEQNAITDLLVKAGYDHLIVFVVDDITFQHKDSPILCIDLYEKTDNSFRVIPSEMWSVENNLSISNMDFEDFTDSLDSEGIFRGFE